MSEEMNAAKERAVTIGVIGAGTYGSATAHVFADAGRSVLLWGRDAAVVREINERKENGKYLKGLRLADKIRASTDLRATLEASDVVVCSIPTQQIREVFEPFAEILNAKIIVNTSKGIESATLASVSEIFAAIVPKARYAVLSGPSFAVEMVRRLPTAVTVASTDASLAEKVQRWISSSYFRAYRSTDVIGVELAGALKNVVAIASGIVTGLKLGHNAQAAIINRGMVEIMRFARKRGADPMTFLGLSGMGDLILTCTGPLSRNRRLGISLAEGKALSEIQLELGSVAEGVYTAKATYEMSRLHGIEMPIAEQVYHMLYEGGTPQQALAGLMGRGLKGEWEINP